MTKNFYILELFLAFGGLCFNLGIGYEVTKDFCFIFCFMSGILSNQPLNSTCMKRTFTEDLELFAFCLYDHIKYAAQLAF